LALGDKYTRPAETDSEDSYVGEVTAECRLNDILDPEEECDLLQDAEVIFIMDGSGSLNRKEWNS